MRDEFPAGTESAVICLTSHPFPIADGIRAINLPAFLDLEAQLKLNLDHRS